MMKNGLISRNDFFPSLLNSGWDRLFDDLAQSAPIARAFVPPTDIEETATHYNLKLDVPGFSKTDITVEVDDELLKIKGEKTKTVSAETTPKFHLNERRLGHFERSFRFNDDVDFEKIEAQFVDGVLQISIPKKESAKPRKIEVKVS